MHWKKKEDADVHLQIANSQWLLDPMRVFSSVVFEKWFLGLVGFNSTFSLCSYMFVTFPGSTCIDMPLFVYVYK